MGCLVHGGGEGRTLIFKFGPNRSGRIETNPLHFKLKFHIIYQLNRDVAQLARALDRHAADAGSILQCGKGFFSQSKLSLQILLIVSIHPNMQCNAFTSVHNLKIP